METNKREVLKFDTHEHMAKRRLWFSNNHYGYR